VLITTAQMPYCYVTTYRTMKPSKYLLIKEELKRILATWSSK